MMNHSVQLSPEVYQILEQRAAVLDATVDALVEVAVRRNYGYESVTKPAQQNVQREGNGAQVETATLSSPGELDDPLVQLAFLTDEELWQVAQTTLRAEDQARMELLLQKQQATGLTADEQAEAEALADRHDQTMLVRAKAAVLLQARGHDISSLGPKTSAS